MYCSKLEFFVAFTFLLTIFENCYGVGGGKNKKGLKLSKTNDKFILTSSHIPHFDKGKHKNNFGCIELNLNVPESYDPLTLCLKFKNENKNKISAFHKEFKLVINKKVRNDSAQKTRKVLGIKDVIKRSVEGYVIGLGISFVNGYLDVNNFYGTVAYAHLVRQETIICTVAPLALLPEFISLHKNQNPYSKVPSDANAVVSCGDMHRNDEDDIENPFTFLGENPTNVLIKSRSKRQTNSSKSSPPSLGTNVATLPDSFLANSKVPSSSSSSSSSYSFSSRSGHQQPSSNTSPEDVKKEKAVNRTLSKFLKMDKHGTYFASVCYMVDADYLQHRFNGSAEDMTLMIVGYVEIADWILRSTDFNKDGVPDNFGIRLLEVNIDYVTSELKEIDANWGRVSMGTFMRRKEAFRILANVGKHMNDNCDMRSGIAEVNIPKFVMHDGVGCSACKNNNLTSFMNPYVEKFSPRGEALRMMYHQIRILTFGLIHTNSYCINCTGPNIKGRSRQRDVSIIGSIETADNNWGACVVEGDLLSRSNIPINSFKLSVCSKEEGLSCIKEIANRPKCLKFEPEESYCGNGIIEGDEECDCGTLSSCAEQQCLCSPRTGRDPCRIIKEEEAKICLTLIRCRGFRFLYEMGKPNGTHFLSAFSNFLDIGEKHIELKVENRGGSEFGNSAITSQCNLRIILPLLSLIILSTYN